MNMQILQIPYLAIWNGMFRLTENMKQETRNRMLSICCFLLAFYYSLLYSNILNLLLPHVILRGICFSVILFLITWFSVDRKLSRVETRPIVVLVYYFFIATVIIARVQHPTGFEMEGFAALLLLLFPGFYLIWNNRRDYSVLYDRIAFGFVLNGIVFFAFSLYGQPYIAAASENGRYTGLADAPNILAMLYLCTAISALYLIVRKDRKVAVHIIALGISFGMIFLTGSRTAFLAAGLAVFVWLIAIARKNIRKSRRFLLCILSLALACGTARAAVFAVQIPEKYFGYRGNAALREISDSRVKYTDEELIAMGWWHPENQTQANAKKGTANQKTGAQHKKASGSVKAGILFRDTAAESTSWTAGNSALLSSGLNVGTIFRSYNNHGSADQLSSGRLTIYRIVLDHLNWFGNNPKEVPLKNLAGTKLHGVHNTVLDFTYRCGILSGIAVGILELFVLLYIIQCLFGRKKLDAGVLFVLLVFSAYLMESMLEIQVVPFNRDLTCLFYLAFAVMFDGLRGQKLADRRKLRERSNTWERVPNDAAW
jgi:O-antigen ligase